MDDSQGAVSPCAVALSPEQLPGHKEVLNSSGGEAGIGMGH